ncbi:MAG TPA: acyl-ACP--UDP-N-acetylglucosamine O-acyltransferase [Gemmataceae bacterium]|nr:acyl-ACP--UDP-N-acetylglucosamine O-acyltransferase [Gemmataceae bacterium]
MDSSSVLIHPTAIVSPKAELAANVTVGAFALLEGEVRLGPGCMIGPRAHLIGPLTMGQDNHVYSNAVIGERPQHLQYRDEPTGVQVGDGNIFRENITVHRGTVDSGRTVIGNRNHFMTGSHVAHDCHVGDHCTLSNNGLLGGHCIVSDGAYVGGNSAAHQFCRLGRLSLLEDTSSTTVDIPPFIVSQGRNIVVGVNVAGMREAGLDEEQVIAMRQCYETVYLQGFVLNLALARLEGELGTVDVVREFVAFTRSSRRGIGRARELSPDATI